MGQAISKAESPYPSSNQSETGEEESFQSTSSSSSTDSRRNKQKSQQPRNVTSTPRALSMETSSLELERYNNGTGIKTERVAAVLPISSCSGQQKMDKNRYPRPKSFNPAVSNDDPVIGNQKFLKTGNDREATISIAPPESWMERTEEDSDREMEDGELSCSDEEGNNNDLSCASRSGPAKPVMEKRYTAQQDGDEKALKRRKLDATSHESSCSSTSTAVRSCGHSSGLGGTEGSSSGTDNENHINKCAHCSSNDLSESSTADLSGNDQRLNLTFPQPLQQHSMDESFVLNLNQRGDEERSESLLLPLFREMIDSERKKKTELVDENKRLKSMLAQVSFEKEETFQLLRTSNKKLAEITDASVVLERKVGELNIKLEEKNAVIKNLRKDAFIIRGVILRMNKTFDDLQANENCRSDDSDRLDRLRRNDRNSSSTKDSRSAATRTPPPPLMSTCTSIVDNLHKFKEQQDKDKSSSSGKSSASKPYFSAEEDYVLTKLKDLSKWAYSIKDIKKVDGRWRCPECGDGKFTLLATAAHARDKHVWKIGAGVRLR